MDCRAAAARCLAAISNGLSLSQQIPIFEQQVSERDRALFRQLNYGVLRFYPKLFAIVSQLLAKPLKDKDSDVLMLLLLGIYQLSETRIPDHAAVNATVAASLVLKKPWAKRLINGVLRQWQRQHDTLQKNLSPSEVLAHPQWLHEALQNAWPDNADAIEAANNQHPPMCLRVNQQLLATDRYLETLTNQGIEASACDFSPQGIRLAQPVAIEQLPGFDQGWVSVQDEAPQLSTPLLDLAPGQRVLDACCAPGGKTCHILEAEPGLLELVALDIDGERLIRVEQNLERLQLNQSLHAKLIAGDASQTDSWWDGQRFDRILLDVPCSATGVIRRNPDIKLHRRVEDIQQLTQLQLRILSALWTTLKSGGLLLYATCSILPDENENIIASFCQQREDAKHIPIEASWGIAQDYGRQLFPQSNGHDGFFYALISKN
ncbi:MAG: 16S rRNA (cytosine(967)-C(5))-methyltransferase RsmB [Pseudomonadales bacterium]